MIPKDSLIFHFVERTIVNLNYISDRKGESGPYEVTQLINSMLGLLIIPIEKYGKYNRTALSNDKRFEEIKGQYATLIENREINSLFDFLRSLRHAFAHGNIELKGERLVESILIWNYEFLHGRSTDKINWEIEISVEKLHRLVVLIADHISENLDPERFQ
ncbi:HEPN family nuclease [Deinococcus sp. KNUC1210]|nr:HEPN family nuclease [Deinococcus sp. KNUC1210]ULH14670.1 HEPN family nuclease [Deinococcus sp. KNUC1210]